MTLVDVKIPWWIVRNHEFHLLQLHYYNSCRVRYWNHFFSDTGSKWILLKGFLYVVCKQHSYCTNGWGGGGGLYFLHPPLKIFPHFPNLGYSFTPLLVMNFSQDCRCHYLWKSPCIFLTKCMCLCLWLWSCGARLYLPLSAALGGLLCGASERCCVPETPHLIEQDGFPARPVCW